MNRRHLFRSTLVLAAPALLGACGFQLRGAQTLPFKTIAVTPEQGAGVAADMTRYLGDRVVPLVPETGAKPPEVILDIVRELREKIVVGVNSSGQVREYQLRLRLTFKLRTPAGRELIRATEIEQTRDISFNESAVLAKENEETLLYRDMQADIVQQVLRRLSATRVELQQEE